MSIRKIKNKYIIVLFAFVLTVLCLTMGALANDSVSGASEGESEAPLSRMADGLSGAPMLRSINSSEAFTGVELVMVAPDGTPIIGNTIANIQPSDWHSIQYKIQNASVAKDAATGAPMNISEFTISFPTTLNPYEPTLTSGITGGLTLGGGQLNYQVAPGTPHTDVSDFLNKIYFTISPDASGNYPYPGIGSEITIIGTTGTGQTYYRDENGIDHIYQRIPFSDLLDNTTEVGKVAALNTDYTLSGSTIKVTWLQAYNLAQKMATPGIIQTSHNGYLATITSQEEQDTIYNRIASEAGWLGGTRMLYSPTGTASGLSRRIGVDSVGEPSEELLPDINSSTPIGTYFKYLTSNTLPSTAPSDQEPYQWYWACGPEAGKTFYGRPIMGTTSSRYDPVEKTGANPVWDPATQSFTVDSKYNDFNNIVNNPTGTITPTGLQQKVEPNNSNSTTTGEYCLQFAFSYATTTQSPYWNDFRYNDNNSMTAFYVEWGGYDGDKIKTSIVLDIPQPIITQYKLNWNEGDATNSSLTAPEKHYFFGEIESEINGGGVQSKPSDFVNPSDRYSPTMLALTILPHFIIKEDVLLDPSLYPVFSKEPHTITYVYWGIEMNLNYHPNGGAFPGANPNGPITLNNSRYMEPLPELPASQNPSKHSSAWTSWTVGPNGSPDNFAELANVIEFDTTPPAAVTSPTVTRHTVVGDMEAHARWTRTHWDLYFDGNGGQLAGVASMQFPLVPGTTTANASISTYLPDGANQPTWFANAFLGWANAGNIQNQDTTNTPGTFVMTGDVYLTAQWLDLEGYVSRLMKDTVIYKDGMTAEEVLVHSGLRPAYLDLFGNEHIIPLSIDFFNQSTISDGGVTAISVTLTDPITGGVIALPKDFVDLYSLNRPYLDGNDTYYMFVGEAIPTGNNFNVYLYVETPNFANRSIDGAYLSVDEIQGYIDGNLIGLYPGHFDTLFKDFFGDNISLTWPVTTIVREPAGLTKEEKRQVEASEFWVKTTEIYHEMKPGQIIEVNESNFREGGRLVDEKIPEGAAYDRQIRVTPGVYYYMNPCILDRIKEDEAGRMDVYLPGRSLTFNSWDFDTDPTISDAVKFDPRSYFDLRMSAVKNEKITKLVGAESPQMQVYFEMNRPWYAEAQFGLTVNDALKTAANGGKTLYLFNYNENTNELELVGPMMNQGNGYFSTQMTGVYHNYVIVAGLPQSGSYRLTNKTNSLDQGTVQQVTQNLKDSGKATVEGEELNAISTTKKFLNEDKSVAENVPGEITTITGEKKMSNMARGIFAAAIGIVVAGGGVFIYLKKRG